MALSWTPCGPCVFFIHRSWLLTSLSYWSHVSLSCFSCTDVSGLPAASQLAAALSLKAGSAFPSSAPPPPAIGSLGTAPASAFVAVLGTTTLVRRPAEVTS